MGLGPNEGLDSGEREDRVAAFLAGKALLLRLPDSCFTVGRRSLFAGGDWFYAKLCRGESEDLIDDLLDGGAVRLDLMRVLGWAQRRDRALAVDFIAEPHIVQNLSKIGLFSPCGKFSETTSRPLFNRRVQVDFQWSLRQDDCADVPTNHHHTCIPACARTMCHTDPALLAAQFLPDLVVRGHDGNDSVYAGGMNGPGYVLLGDLDRRLAPIGLSARGHTDFYGQLLGNAANGGTVSAINAPFEYGPSDRPIHDPRIEKRGNPDVGQLGSRQCSCRTLPDRRW